MLVVSAVEGVQAQTRVLMRTLQRLHIPTLIFVNKIDRVGAHYERLLQRLTENLGPAAGSGKKLTPAIVPMGTASGLGSRDALFTPYAATDTAFTARLVDVLADHDEAFLAAYVDDETTVSYRQLRDGLAAQTKQALVHPVFFGSAITGAGVDALIAGVRELLPAAEGDLDAPASGTVFKVERGPAGEKIAYVRMFSGTVRTRDRLRFRRDSEEKVTAVSVFDRGAAMRHASVGAGQIGKLWGLGAILPVLARLRAVPQTPAVRGSSSTLEGDIPAARVHELQQQLPALTRGEGVLESAFDHYEPARATIPTRPRSDHNPLNRKEYLLHVLRRV